MCHSQVNHNCTLPSNKFCATSKDDVFQTHIMNWLCTFCMVIETAACDEDSKDKLLAYLEIASESDEITSSLTTFTRTHMFGSFFTKLECLCFRHYMHLKMGQIDQNCFSEFENSALSRDKSGPKSNHKLHVAINATTNHIKKMHATF